MHPLYQLFRNLIDPSGFVPRAVCGQWTPEEVLLNNVSDLLIALAYVSIPIMLTIFARKQRSFPFSWLSAVFAAFILTCGATHIMEIVLFYYPIYHLAGWIKAVTALSSWVAVIALYKVLPMALTLHSPDQLQAAKDELTNSHRILEAKLQSNNKVLVSTNRKMSQTLKELEEANEIKSRFLANLSHELRTPMVSIIGLSELALEDETWNVRESLLKISRSAKSLDALLADLLEFSKLEAGKIELRPRPFKLEAIYDNIQATLAHLASQKGLELLFEADKSLLTQPYFADASRLQHVLINLTQNALKFTDQGQVKVHIETTVSLSESDRLRFSVSDTGVGIANDKLSEIFEPFRQVDDSLSKREAGSGLGLAISKEFLLLMQGELRVESVLGEGSRFWFELELPKSYLNEDKPPAKVQSDKTGRLLLVEDNPINRVILEKILGNAGHTVFTAGTGAEALDLFGKETFDLALVDLQLPDLDGVSIAHQVRANGITIPIFALTAHGEESYQKRAKAAGMTGFLVKPIPSVELLSVIREALENSPREDEI